MARIRTIKPEFWADEVVAGLSLRARLLFIGTWNFADDEGLLRWAPDYIKASVFMYDSMTIKPIALVMNELVEAKIVFPYKGGKTLQSLAYIPSFLRHQRINRPQPSKLPAPSLMGTQVRLMYADRDGWRCHICNGDIPRPETPEFWNSDEFDRLSLDHVHPRIAGGSDYPSNIRSSHRRCNSSKGESFMPDDVKDSLNGSPPEGSKEEEGNREEELPPPPVSEEPPAVPEPGGGDFDQRINDAARLVAEAECERRGGEIGNPEGYIRSRVAPIRAQHEPAWRLILAAHPTTTATHLAGSDQPPSPLDATAAAQAALMDRNRRRQAGEACPDCNDVGIVEQEDGTYEDCACKYRATA